VVCWGYNGYGQLGDGTVGWRSSPTDVAGLQAGLALITEAPEHIRQLG
jgi:hypothetical protein